MAEDLPYRPCVGLCVFNRDGLVFVGRRAGGQELMDAAHAWQMPQGGVDEGEELYDAALRELHEETNIQSVKKIGEIGDWLFYDLPADLVGKAWRGRYRGQKQKWYALAFTGPESEIDILRPADEKHKPEFEGWRWVKIGELPDLAIPFKRPIYERVAKEFAPLAKAHR